MFANTFPDRAEMARLTARMLLEIKAVNFRPENPYTLASGMVSPSYIDCRELISFPRIRSALVDFMVATVYRDAGFEAFDSVAGGETGGIPYGAWMADRMGLPMQYVRKKPKGYGKNSQVEGVLHPGQRVLLAEDMTTDGGSKVKFVQAIRDAGGLCNHTALVFFYDIFPGTQERLAAEGIRLHYLATWHDVLAEAGDYFDAATIAEVRKFFADPFGWSVAHGGKGAD
ncbi:orotate phosphoribosyltransferase [Abyssibius alkaniclasticus]|uniref:orotate phosphoribosyltransferase n=1 Tax=Abyssibius alkaniclasticus TaxID=2881234 RepID=UPI0023632FE0|nr:orotate phosphoribosyltransferase [Abyssibius alkaniclasticus]UPH70055.1 orotate phosphoribosyltransferase [Abyssibius alkaniclasticus]